MIEHSAGISSVRALPDLPPVMNIEALAHSPSRMPLSCPVAPPSQRELHKDGGGGGGGVARRVRVLLHVLRYVLGDVIRAV